MLTIRDAQMQELARQREEAFVRRMSEQLPGSDTETFVRQGLESARGFGITREDHVARYLQVVRERYVEQAPELPREALSILTTQTDDAEGKVSRFEKWGGQPEPGDSSAFGSTPVGAVVTDCPLRKKEKHWIEVELLGEDDEGIPYAAYEVELPGGSVVRGYLDGVGFARVDGIDPGGTCRVCFPELDEEAWAFFETAGPK